MVLRSLALLCVLLALLAIPAQARPTSSSITVVDDQHTTITLAAPPRRIIALAPNVTEILFALGLGPEVVGVSTYSNYPKAAAKLPVVINYTGLNLEKIVALKPDLLVAAAIVPQTIVTKLRNLHYTVLMTDPHDLAGIMADIRLVGTACGVPGAAQTVVAGMQQRIDAVHTALAHITARPRVYYELDNTYYTVGRGSFMDALITLAGATNIAGKVANPYPQLSAEKVIAADPQYIILGDTPFVAPSAVAKRPGWSLISAVKAHRIYPFNDDLASRPGPRIVLGLETLARLLHPEVFR
jgi:iron complex transport system substrate-binding protein